MDGPAAIPLESLADPSLTVPVVRKKHEVIEQVILLGLDDASMVGAPTTILAGELADLRKPDSVIVDYARLQKLYPGEGWKEGDVASKPVSEVKFAFVRDGVEWARRRLGLMPASEPGWRAKRAALNREFFARFLGRELEMNDTRAVIVGVCEATRTFQSNAVVYTTFSRTKRFVPKERKMLSYVLAKVEPGYRPRAVAESIRARTGLKSVTRVEFVRDTIQYYMKYTGIPINFGITAMLGFLVGTAIAGQTFYNFTLDNIRQFGALKAMGATNPRIVGMILLQALVVGLLGYGMGVGLAAFFGEATKGGELAFYTPWELLPITGGAVVLICILSSVLSVRRVLVLEPAVVFRG
ncbi:MAG: ABC transporter permease [Isosphaeraceae bacterium]